MSKLRVGIVGLGWGQLMLEAFRRVQGTEVVALCDLDAARLAQVAANYRVTPTFTDYRDLIARGNVDLIGVATPPETHQVIAQMALNANIHLLMEKPLAANLLDTQELYALQQSRESVCAVNFEMRYLPALAYAKELIDEAYLGRLLRVDVTLVMDQPWGVRGNWLADDARGGGVLLEMGSNFVDVLRWWFGDVCAVLANRQTHFATLRFPAPQGSKDVMPPMRQVTGDDAFWCVMQFKNGGEALLNFFTGARHDPGWTISAYGATGSLVISNGQLLGKRDVDREMAILPIPKRLELGDNPQDPLMWAMAKLAGGLVAAIKRDANAQRLPGFGDSVAVAEIIDAIRRASEQRAWVNVE